MKAKNKTNIGVILMTYGSPSSILDVPEYLKNVYGGKDASPHVIAELQRRYKLIGGSPLIRITQDQATALQNYLNNNSANGFTYHVVAGMRFSQPFISEELARIATNTEQVIGIIMSPQYSPIIMSGYVRQLEDSVARLQRNNFKLSIVKDWHLQPFFIQAMAQRVTEALERFPQNIKKAITVLFSAHSMPKRIIDKEPGYINDLKETARAIAKQAGLPKNRWMFCYQSAGHTPEEWLKPDFADIMPELQKRGQNHVLIAPVQFLSDHLEILYDVGIGAKEQAEAHGIQFARTESLNTSPLFIKALAAIVKKNTI